MNKGFPQLNPSLGTFKRVMRFASGNDSANELLRPRGGCPSAAKRELQRVGGRDVVGLQLHKRSLGPKPTRGVLYGGNRPFYATQQT